MRYVCGGPSQIWTVVLLLSAALLASCSKSGSSGTAPTSPKLGVTCTDGTVYGQCSASRPLFCDAGRLIEDRQNCDSIDPASFSVSAKAVQTIYKSGPPHVDRIGNIRRSYSRTDSFFPIWMYGLKHPRTAYLCHPEEATKAWRSASDPRVTHIELLKQANFNVAQYWGEYSGSEEFLAEVTRQKFQAMMYWKPLNQGLAAEPQIFDFIHRNANHPNILAWNPTEETGHYMSHYLTAAMPSIYDWLNHFFWVRWQIRFQSPRPIFNIDNLWAAHQTELNADASAASLWRQWNDPNDVIALDVYPERLKSLQTFDTAQGLARAGSYVTSVYGQSKPYWVLLNAFEKMPLPGQEKIYEFPSPQQMRAMAFLSIVQGATGIGYFLMDDYASRKSRMIGIRPDTPTRYLRQGACAGSDWSDMLEITDAKAAESRALWQAVSTTNSHIQTLAPVLLSETSYYYYRIDVSGQPVSETPIRAMLKESGGYFYLIAVNLDRAKLLASFNIEIAAAPSEIEVLFENRFIRPAPRDSQAITGKFIDSFNEFDVHVYRWPSRR